MVPIESKVTQIIVENSYGGLRRDVYIIGETNDQRPRPCYLAPAEMVLMPFGAEEGPKPAFSVGMRVDAINHTFQKLVDQLYLMGLRPSEHLRTPEDQPSMKNHLDDMRRLVFESDIINWREKR